MPNKYYLEKQLLQSESKLSFYQFSTGESTNKSLRQNPSENYICAYENNWAYWRYYMAVDGRIL